MKTYEQFKNDLKAYPPIDCPYAVGDKVIFTNQAGCRFNAQIIGFAADDNFYGRFIHTIPESGGDKDAYWFPKRLSEISKKGV